MKELQALLSALPDAVVAFDPTGRIHTTNAAAEHLFRYPTGGLVGRSVFELVPSLWGPRDRWPVGRRQGCEGLRRDGSRFPAEIAVGEADGSYVGVVHDVTRIRDLEGEVLAAADAVRQLVAEELHDDVGQQLTGLELMVDALSRHPTVSADPAVGSLVSNVAQGLHQVHAATRQLVGAIVPAEVDSDGLVAALDRFAARVRAWYGCGCDLVASGPVSLPGATTTQLYRIVQEAVSNALRHGEPKTIRVTVQSDADGLGVEVRDDGGGISDQTDGVGDGTKFMRMRAARIGGTLAITPVDGGTVVAIRCPKA